jgi:ChrR Cupin-like domain
MVRTNLFAAIERCLSGGETGIGYGKSTAVLAENVRALRIRYVLSDIPWSDAPVPVITAEGILERSRYEAARGDSSLELGAKLPRHRHIGDELLFMIEGSNFDQADESRTGNVAYFPSGCTHSVISKMGHTAIAFTTGKWKRCSAAPTLTRNPLGNVAFRAHHPTNCIT